jgi:hypothetical protein
VQSPGVTPVPDIDGLDLETNNERQRSPPSGRKRPADTEPHTRREKAPSHVEVIDSDYTRDIPYTAPSVKEQTEYQSRQLNPIHGQRDAYAPTRGPDSRQNMASQSRQPGLVEPARYDPRYPGLLLQPDSRPISQEQLASEVKSIYAGLTMVETKCIHVDRAQAVQDAQDPNVKLAADHNFFLASQHPSANPALRRLAQKYSMPARMWKHRISADGPKSTGSAASTAQRCNSTYEIPSVVKSRGKQLALNALGDTCATENFMSPACATKLGLDIDKSRSRLVRVGSGAQVKTAGVVSTNFHFRDEPDTEYPLLFHVLPNIAQELVLGKTFLNLTSTFKSKANRLRRVKERFVETLKQYHLLYLGDSGPNFTGLINGRTAKALADTGSNVLVMDETFAAGLGLQILRGPEHRNRLIFADGSTKMTTGMTYDVEWRFGVADKSYNLNFHILENSPAPIILSDSFLFDTDAYDEYECYSHSATNKSIKYGNPYLI